MWIAFSTIARQAVLPVSVWGWFWLGGSGSPSMGWRRQQTRLSRTLEKHGSRCRCVSGARQRSGPMKRWGSCSSAMQPGQNLSKGRTHMGVWWGFAHSQSDLGDQRFTGVGSRPSCRCPVSIHCGVLCGQMNGPSGSHHSSLHCNLSLYLIVKHIGNGRIHTSMLKSGRRTCGRMLFWPGAIYLSWWCLTWCGCAWAVAQWAWWRSPSSWEGRSRFECCPEDWKTGRTRWP